MITETRNMEVVNAILQDPCIWNQIANVEPFDTPYIPECIYFLVNDYDGVIIFHPYRDSIKIHPNIIPKKRGKLAYDAVEEACQVMFERGFKSIYAEIDPQLKHVMRFAKQMGFRLVEVANRDILVRRKLDS